MNHTKMSAPFTTSYSNILNRNLRHIYSGTPPQDIRFHLKQYHEGLTVYDRMQEDRWKKPRKELPDRCYEYIPEYNISIQGAPAFRPASRKKVNSMVWRLQHSESLKKPRISPSAALQAKLIRDTSSLQSPDSAITYESETSGQRKSKKPLSQKDVNKIVERLYGEKTHCSKLRESLTSPPQQPYKKQSKSVKY